MLIHMTNFSLPKPHKFNIANEKVYQVKLIYPWKTWTIFLPWEVDSRMRCRFDAR